MILRDLHHIGAAVAVRHLHHAEPVAMRMQPHGLGIDRHRIGVEGQIGQIAAMQAYGHGVRDLVESMRTKLPLKLERGERPVCLEWATGGHPRMSGAQERTRTFTAVKPLAPEASASTNSATWARAGYYGSVARLSNWRAALQI